MVFQGEQEPIRAPGKSAIRKPNLVPESAGLQGRGTD